MADAGWDTASYLWPDPKKGPYAVWLHFAIVEQRAECVGVDVRAFADPGRLYAKQLPPKADATQLVTGELLRKLRIGEMVDAHRAATLRTIRDYVDETWDVEAQQAAARWTGEAPTERVLKAAAIYLAEWAGGKPTKAVEEQMHVSYSAAAKLVQRARDAGLIPDTTTGRTKARKQRRKVGKR